MKFERTQVYNIDGAFRGMRNPLASWSKSDSIIDKDNVIIGDNDMSLAQRLIKAGTEHCKFMRQIFVSVDITAPIYWWKEFDTYKVGTTANSTSTMHKIASTPITMDCFEMDDFENRPVFRETWDAIIRQCEQLRQAYNSSKDKAYWKELIRLLPESWLQTRTITLNYENIRNMYFQRRNHKLTEWSKSFVEWVDTLPYSEELIKLEG